MRFTRDAYHALPDAFGEAIRSLLGYGHCTIVNLGFRMQSFDFTQLLDAPAFLEIYNLGKDALTVDALVEIEEARRRTERVAAFDEARHDEPDRRQGGPATWRDAMRDDVTNAMNARHDSSTGVSFRFANIVHPGWEPSEHGSLHRLDLQLLALCHQLRGLAIEPQEPATGRLAVGDVSLGGLVFFRDEIRHRTVCELLGVPTLFHAEAANSDLREFHYLQGRAALEMAFSNARSRGLATVESLRLDRPGRYFDLSLQAAKAMSGRREVNLSWNDLTMAGGFVESPRSSLTLVADEAVCGSQPERRTEFVCAQHHGIEAECIRTLDPDRLAQRLVPYISFGWRHDRDETQAEEEFDKLRSTLELLIEGTEVEVHSRDDRVCRSQFVLPETLATLTALGTRTAIMLNRDGVHGLDIAAETGEWLLSDAVAHRMGLLVARAEEDRDRYHPFQIRLVVAFRNHIAEICERYADADLRIRQLAWWRHNHHMTILRSAANWRGNSEASAVPGGPSEAKHNRDRAAIEAIYFARGRRTPYITPVYLRLPGDAYRLTRDFERLWDEGCDVECRDGIDHATYEMFRTVRGTYWWHRHDPDGIDSVSEEYPDEGSCGASIQRHYDQTPVAERDPDGPQVRRSTARFMERPI